MPELDKVIKGLEFHRDGYCNNKEGEHCPYWPKNDDCETSLAADALLLLGKQEPVIPYPVWRCGNCSNYIPSWTKYCSECGRRVKWDDVALVQTNEPVR